MNRDERRKTQEMFTNQKDVLILVATDAAAKASIFNGPTC